MRSIGSERRSSATTTFIALQPGMRERLDATIEALIALADALDGECDLEPSLCQGAACGELVDLEGDEADDEPDLAEPENVNQGNWGCNGWRHGEQEADDEPDDTGIADLPGLGEQLTRSGFRS